MRLTLVIATLNRGGTERVMSVLANAWAEQGKTVTLITLDHATQPAFGIHPAVELRRLGVLSESQNLLQALCRNAWLLRVLRQAIRQSDPDIVISFALPPNVLSLIATRGLNMPVVVSERMDPANRNAGLIWCALRRFTCGWANMSVFTTASGLHRFYKIRKIAGRVIPNPLVVTAPDRMSRTLSAPKNSPRRTLVAMGRLVPEKGFDLLLEAFAQVADRNRRWSLVILGDGFLRERLQMQVSHLGLDERVRMPGEVRDPLPILRDADLFVLSSRTEGFPNSLCEAMACGLPAISFDCPCGPREIIRGEVDGLLVPPGDVDRLAAALDRLMSNSQERRRLSKRAPEVLERFSLEKVLRLWDDLFCNLLDRNGLDPDIDSGPVRSLESSGRALEGNSARTFF